MSIYPRAPRVGPTLSSASSSTCLRAVIPTATFDALLSTGRNDSVARRRHGLAEPRSMTGSQHWRLQRDAYFLDQLIGFVVALLLHLGDTLLCSLQIVFKLMDAIRRWFGLASVSLWGRLSSLAAIRRPCLRIQKFHSWRPRLGAIEAIRFRLAGLEAPQLALRRRKAGIWRTSSLIFLRTVRGSRAQNVVSSRLRP